MNNIIVAENVIKENNGLAKISDFLNHNLTQKAVERLCNEGYLIRIKKGYYTSSNHYAADEEIIRKLIHEAVISLESALFYYGYVDFTPRVWSITVPNTISRSKLNIESLSIKAYYVEKKYYNIGIVESMFNGVKLNMYDKERTICDCFKYRNKLDNETFNKAVKSYSKDNEKNLYKLTLYAKQLRVYNKVIEYMGVLVND